MLPTDLTSLFNLQYLPEENCAIEGFVVYYRRYNSEENWARQPLMGTSVRRFSVKGLEPKTHYSFKVQTFNSAGNSEDSKKVVRESLGKKIFRNFGERITKGMIG